MPRPLHVALCLTALVTMVATRQVAAIPPRAAAVATPPPAGGEPTYGTGPLEPEKLRGSDGDLAVEIAKRAKFNNVTVIDRLGEGGANKSVWSSSDAASDKLPGVSRAERVALLAVLQRPNVGVEADVLITQPDGLQTPVSIYWDSAPHLSFKSGPAVKSLFTEGVTTEQIRAKYGVGAFTEGDAKWDATALSAVEQALGLLTTDEVALLKDVPFKRSRQSPPNPAIYRRGGDDTAVNVYDACFELDHEMFMGTPAAPRSHSVGIIVHELGHAIADARPRELYWRTKIVEGEYKTAVAASNEAGAAYNAKLRDAAGNPDKAAAKAEIVALQERMTKAKQDSSAAMKEANDFHNRLGAVDNSNKSKGGRIAERELTTVQDPAKAPTRYGRTNAGEAFAESFRLFKVDPDALKRIAPTTFDWFQSAHHVTVATRAL